ncbi:hypothetical protein Tco_0133787 [Tanacetum coccineum]
MKLSADHVTCLRGSTSLKKQQVFMIETDWFIRELMIESQEAAGDLFGKDIGEVCTAKAVRLILLGTKWFMLLALSDIGHSGELRLLVASDIGSYLDLLEELVTKKVIYHLFDDEVEFHRFVFLSYLKCLIEDEDFKDWAVPQEFATTYIWCLREMITSSLQVSLALRRVLPTVVSFCHRQ